MKRELISSGKNYELGKNTAFQPLMENENVLLASKSSLTCNLQCSSSRGQSIGKCSLKQKSLDNCSFDLPSPQESTYRGSQRKRDDGPRFDLNIAASALDESMSGSVMEQADNERLRLEGLLFRKSGSICPPMLPNKSYESGNCFRPSNLSQPTDQHSDSGISLDLQLKQPHRPGPHFSWPDTGPGIQDSGADLSLSLAAKLSRASSTVQLVPDKEIIQKNNNVVELCLTKLMMSTHVKSEQCDLTLQDAAPNEAGSSNLRMNCRKEKEIEGKPLEVGLQMNRGPEASSVHVSLIKQTVSSCDGKQIGDSIGGKILSSESKFVIDLNSKPVDSGDNMHDVPMCLSASAPAAASKLTEKGPSRASSRSPIPDSNESVYYYEVPKSPCLTGDAKGNIEKASTSVSKSLEFKGNEHNAEKDRLTGLERMNSSSLLGSMALKNNESSPLDDDERTAAGAKIGDFADVVASDGEDLKSLKIAAGSALMEADRNDDVDVNSGKIEASSEVDEESRDFDYASNNSQHVAENILEQLDDDDNYEDVELTDTNDECESSVERTEERKLQGEEGVDSTPVNNHSMKPLHGDGKDKNSENYEGCIDNRELGITKPENLLPHSEENPQNSSYRGNEESIARTSNKGGCNNVNRRGGGTARGKVFTANGGSSNQGNWRGILGRSIMQYTAPNRSSYKKMKPNNTIPMASYAEGEIFSNNVYRRGKPHSWRHSAKNHNDRFHKPDAENSLQQFGRQRSDCTWVRRDPDRIKTAHQHDYAVTVGTGERPVKKWFRDESVHVPHPPPQSREFHNANRPMRHIGPHRQYIEREVPHFRIHSDYNEKFLSELQDETTNCSLSYAQQQSLHSSQRPSEQSPDQWFLHGKAPDLRNGRPKLINRKLIRGTRKLPLRPLLQHPHFPQWTTRRQEPIVDEEGVDRPITDQPLRIVGSSRKDSDQNCDSNPQHIQGGFRPLRHDEYNDYVQDAEFENDRYEERHGTTRPFRQQHSGEQQGPPFVVENSHVKPNRYHFKKGRNDIGYNGAPVKRRY